jgi:hypothetical protein
VSSNLHTYTWKDGCIDFLLSYFGVWFNGFGTKQHLRRERDITKMTRVKDEEETQGLTRWTQFVVKGGWRRVTLRPEI